MGQGRRLIFIIASILCLTCGTSFAASTEAQVLFDQGKAYHDGIGVRQDFDMARDYYERAAEAGNTDAQLNLGYLYFVGEGVTRNFTTARKWYEKAAKAGDASAQQNLNFMNERGLGLPKKPIPTFRMAAAKPAPVITPAPIEVSEVVLDLDASFIGLEFLDAEAANTFGPFHIKPPRLGSSDVSAKPKIKNALAAKVLGIENKGAPNLEITAKADTPLTVGIAKKILSKGGTDTVKLIALIFVLIFTSLFLLLDAYVKARKRATHKLAVEFFEHNRRTVRDAYFRYSAELRDMRYSESKLDAVLSVLIVRFVLAKYGEEDHADTAAQGKLVERILHLAKKHPAKSRHLAGSLAPHILGLIRSDIRALDREYETQTSAPSFYKAPDVVPVKSIWKPRIVKVS